MTQPVYIVGIDLGTTNSVVAYTPAELRKGEKSEIRIFEIPQLVAPGTVEKREVLPSFVLVPGKLDASEGSLSLPWDPENSLAVGEHARERGAEIPQRLIASAKSWLCHPLVDRNKPILPWEGPDDAPKLSPVEASSRILRHIRDAWNDEIARTGEGFEERLGLENQEILLTVPASFDAVARELTVRAAEMAGLPHLTLLEEPQAAFYAWIDASGEKWREAIRPGDLVLVCDVGGGTSDFSMIRVIDAEGDLALERIAVGDHLLVGGENMDLALAYTVSRKFSEKGIRLDSWQMRALWHACRSGKEILLSDSEASELPVAVLGRGSSLIGGTLKSTLGREEVSRVVLDGFFPFCDRSDKPSHSGKAGIRELGLSYAADPAVTRHLAQFVGRNAAAGGGNLPTAVLFNGGVMKAEAVRKRIMDVISSWGSPELPASIREIGGRDFDLAVAKGAACYGIARRGGGIRIRGGLARTYYIGIAASMPAVPGIPAPTKALCVAPFGMEEGTRASLEGQEFVLAVGEPVKFDFLASSLRREDPIGSLVEDWEGEIEEVTTLETTLAGEAGSVVPVTLEVRATEIGTLELWCVGDDDRKWRLEFNVREKEEIGPSG